MQNTLGQTLIDRAKESASSDYKTTKTLGVSPQVVFHGTKRPGLVSHTSPANDSRTGVSRCGGLSRRKVFDVMCGTGPRLHTDRPRLFPALRRYWMIDRSDGRGEAPDCWDKLWREEQTTDLNEIGGLETGTSVRLTLGRGFHGQNFSGILTSRMARSMAFMAASSCSISA